MKPPDLPAPLANFRVHYPTKIKPLTEVVNTEGKQSEMSIEYVYFTNCKSTEGFNALHQQTGCFYEPLSTNYMYLYVELFIII